MLTNDGRLQARIADPKFKMEKTYLVQLEGEVSDAALNQLATGIELKDGLTRPAMARRIDCPLPPRHPPIQIGRAHV